MTGVLLLVLVGIVGVVGFRLIQLLQGISDDVRALTERAAANVPRSSGYYPDVPTRVVNERFVTSQQGEERAQQTPQAYWGPRPGEGI